MNDAAVIALWEAMRRLARRVESLEWRMNTVDARIRARLKEEAEAREDDLLCPTCGLGGPLRKHASH